MGFRQDNFDYLPDYSVYRHKGTDVYLCVCDASLLAKASPLWLRHKPDGWVEIVETIEQVEACFHTKRPFGLSLHLLTNVVQRPDYLSSLCRIIEENKEYLAIRTHIPLYYQEHLSSNKHRCLSHTFWGDLSRYLWDIYFTPMQICKMREIPPCGTVYTSSQQRIHQEEIDHLEGIRHHQEMNLGEAENAYRRCLRDNPLHLGATYQLARLLHWDKTEEALSLYERVLVLRPNHINAYLEMSHAYAWQGDNLKAKKTLLHGQSIVSGHWERLYMGYYSWFGNKSKCIKQLGRMELSPFGISSQNIKLKYSNKE